MKMVIFQCALISYMYLLNIAYSQDETNVEESSENSTDVLVQESNYSIPLFNMSDTDETNESSPDCLLFIEENGSYVETNRTKEELTQDNIPYFECCTFADRKHFE
ncbi:uncharacterized protein isoform X2 [Rhodnius prolixus]|uniref:uncharacterized protein isoform X2 n=1 Tax=Rhodnius prolixus TaxID=13249 RepID=UPI003D18BC6A